MKNQTDSVPFGGAVPFSSAVPISARSRGATSLRSARAAAGRLLSALAGSASALGLSAAALLCAGVASGQVTPDAAMMRFPDVSKDSIVFVYANDLWLVPRAGGVAKPLASPPGAESLPKFSPDGASIAFIGNYDGNRDVYVMPAAPSSAGGVPRRITHHPAAELVSDWTPDGRILFISNGLSGLTRQQQLFTVSAEGGQPERLPIPYGAFAGISPDGVTLAYTPNSTDFRTWKRYRGGLATDIWLFNLKDKTSRRATDWEGTDTIPMWVPGGDGREMYYLSDAGPEHRLNIWKLDVATGNRTQVTRHTDHDVKWPSIGPGPSGGGEIVFQLGSELRLLNLADGGETVVKVTIPGDRPTIRPRMVNAAQFVQGASISPTGKRVALNARGDIWSAPAKEGVVRNLTRTNGVYERDVSWSPDGRWLAYFSDESGEYELYIRESDGRAAPPKDDKKPEAGKQDAAGKDAAKPDADKPAEKPDADKQDAAKPAEGAGEAAKAAEAPITTRARPVTARKLTNLGPGFRFGPTWSPDSKWIAFTQQNGAVLLTNVESGETRTIDTDPWGNTPRLSWSHDSNWIAYAKADEGNSNNAVWLYNVKEGKATRVTSPMFSSSNPTFDRKGDYLYFSSQREFSAPIYSDIDTTFVYTGSEVMVAAPLRKDVKNPLLPKSDEEEIKAEEKKADKDAAKAKPEQKEGGKDEKKDDAAPDDGLSGTWTGTATGGNMPPNGAPFTLKLTLAADGSVTGTAESPMGSGAATGSYEKDGGRLSLTLTIGQTQITLTGTVQGGEASGAWKAGESAGEWKASRKAAGAEGGDDKNGKDAKDAKEEKPLVIDLEGFERRAFQIPVPRGSFGAISVAHDSKIIYTRNPARGSSEPSSIRILDLSDDEREEKTVLAGAGAYEMSADGKKLLVFRGGSNLSVVDAAAGGKSTAVVTAGMMVEVDPREEWGQVFNDTWRIFRDWFYEPTMHGVDWQKVGEQYRAMLADCVSREDVAYVQAELVSELNVGHAYVNSPGDVESSVPSVGVGLLGCDYELVKGEAGAPDRYRIVKIHGGGDWDLDARGPLGVQGVDVKEGDFLLAVNGVEVDTRKDVWAAFLDTAGRTTTITVSESPAIDAKARDVVVRPLGGEAGLRFRSWIESNRRYVEEKSGGKIGYIYVPNTGVDGQNELFRQFYGQREKDALLIDERWNGGGQIPTRFIELLARKPVNYWGRRNGKDWPWPPDAHFGPKAMLANGPSGSGGDAFPHYFKTMGLGKLFGTRTWGGLVGISGNPGLIDGGSISVPTFGFYSNEGRWAIEGHGVDPDVEVIDDPAQMQNGNDPQINAAVEHLLNEIRNNPYIPPTKPQSPNRRGMGIPENER